MESGGAELLIIFGILIAMAVLFLFIFLPGLLYLISLQKAFSRCRPSNRLMPPGLVWLMVIPFFNIVWHFVVVLNLATSLKKEFRDRGIEVESAPGQALGIAMCALNVCSVIPYLGVLSSIASFICWICYWVKIADYSGQLAEDPWETLSDPAPRYEPRSKYRSNLYSNRSDRVAPNWR